MDDDNASSKFFEFFDPIDHFPGHEPSRDAKPKPNERTSAPQRVHVGACTHARQTKTREG